jgi:hypothetical protein
MTPTQEKAEKALQNMRYRLDKATKYDQEKTRQKQQEEPKLAVILDEQLQDRINQRQERINVFSNLLKEAMNATETVNSMYQGFKNACSVADVLNVAEDEMDQMPLNQLIICQHAKVWRAHFPEMSRQHAVYRAITDGNPHNWLLFNTELVEPDPNRPKTINIKRKWNQLA